MGHIKSVLICLAISVLSMGFSSAQVELRYEQNYSLSYDEVIRAYRDLDREYSTARLLEYGRTDVGRPLHLFVISFDQTFDPVSIHKDGKAVVLILNGIHPGESCGIDASVKLSREILSQGRKNPAYMEHTVLCIIPVYNIGGALNRSAYHRTNMDPPVESGFRGNAANLDLNRDFIKLDSRNARSFVEICRQWDPDVFLDNHVTNGSDHQYTVTLFSSVTERLDPGIADFLDHSMLPGLYKAMATTPYEMTPYVNFMFRSPDNGIARSMDPPKYSCGYTALFNTLSFLNEIHVYKPFPDQVRASYYFMKELLKYTDAHAGKIRQLRGQAKAATSNLEEYGLDWKLDSTREDSIYFKGYAYKRRFSPLTGDSLNYYDRDEPWEKWIPYYQSWLPGIRARVPAYFIIPQAWRSVLERLEWNGIEMRRLPEDTLINVKAYYIDDISFAGRPFNGHFVHRDLVLREEEQPVQFYRGDYIIPGKQEGTRYLMEVLDPRAEDSFLKWNFFDPVLDRREYIDPSGFEQRAGEILDSDPELREEFEDWKAEKPDASVIGYYQMQFIYIHSDWSEKTYRRYPVFRIE